MSLYTDIEYARRVGSQLSLFTEESTGRFTFRCCFCGDSKKHKNMKRAGLFSDGSKLFFNCMNCGKGTNMRGLLECVDPMLMNEYTFESLRENNGGSSTIVKEDTSIEDASAAATSIDSLFQIDAPKKIGSMLDHLTPLKTLPDDHMAVKYVRGRGVDVEDLMYTDNFALWANKHCGKELKVPDRDPRVVAPLYSADGTPMGGQGRSLIDVDGRLRYITVTSDTTAAVSYGLNRADRSNDIWVVEGVYDALTIKNGVAALTSSLSQRAEQLGLSKETTVLLFDNEPGNPQIVSHIKKAVKGGWRVAFWVGDAAKDVNDLENKGISIYDYVNVYSGLRAEMEMARWGNRY